MSPKSNLIIKMSEKRKRNYKSLFTKKIEKYFSLEQFSTFTFIFYHDSPLSPPSLSLSPPPPPPPPVYPLLSTVLQLHLSSSFSFLLSFSLSPSFRLSLPLFLSSSSSTHTLNLLSFSLLHFYPFLCTLSYLLSYFLFVFLCVLV